MFYKNYECRRNRLTGSFYAYPANALTTDGKITAATADELKAAIDAATTEQRLNPWELPYATAQSTTRVSIAA